MQTGKQRRLVLAVDDHPSILRFVQTGLEIRGFEVMTAASGKEAVTLVRSANPDVVLLDIMMPDTDGLEVLKQIRSMSDVPVIAFSAYHEARKDALRLGADDFVPNHLTPMTWWQGFGPCWARSIPGASPAQHSARDRLIRPVYCSLTGTTQNCA
jgi:CheY-like chemotaxis protein